MSTDLYNKAFLMNHRIFSSSSLRALVTAAALVVCGAANASHEPAAISDIDGVVTASPQTFSGFYTHVPGSSGDHPWFVFNGTAGSTIGIFLTTSFGNGSYLWLYDVLNDMPKVGDSTSNGALALLAQSSNTDAFPGPFNDQSISYSLGSSGVFAIQVDSWLGGSGNYMLTITGAVPANNVPEPGTLLLLALGLGAAASISRWSRRKY